MKFTFFLSILLAISLPVFSQTVNVSTETAYSGNNEGVFPVQGGTIRVSGGQLLLAETAVSNLLAWSVSPRGEKVGVLEGGATPTLLRMESSGESISHSELEFSDPQDETLSVYQFDDGRSVVRDNVANFSFYDAKGDIKYSMSNSAQSPDGERPSEMASDPAGRTVVLYNPVIAYGGNTGSRARLVYGEEDDEIFFEDREREIRSVRISNDGAFITLVAAGGSGSVGAVYDRFGNQITEIPHDELLTGAELTDDREFLVLHTSRRVQVYRLLTGERIASASTGSSIITAQYLPEDEIIIALCGSAGGSGEISGPSVTAVHVGARQIATSDIINQGLSLINGTIDVDVQRKRSGEYRITGLNQPLDVETIF